MFKKGCSRASSADIRFEGSSSRQRDMNCTASFSSSVRGKSVLRRSVHHSRIFSQLWPFSLMVGMFVWRTWPCRRAASFMRRLPKMLHNSMKASMSSAEWKKGKRRLRRVRRMMPQLQMSIIQVCDVHLSRTSGARKPLVPARFALREFRESSLGYAGGGGSWPASRYCVRMDE